MTYREKFAWLSLISMAVTFGPYFTFMALFPPTDPLPDLPTMRLFAVAAISQGLILLGGYLWLRFRTPDDARAPADERDRVINSRSFGAAYYVLIGGMIVVGCIMPFTTTGWELVNSAAVMIVLAEVVRDTVVVWNYRQ